jgi:ABC-type transport system involved in cytochrome c biogenesis permease component
VLTAPLWIPLLIVLGIAVYAALYAIFYMGMFFILTVLAMAFFPY